MLILQCWDDGVTSDIRLTDILRRHHAKATFNLNAGLHGPCRGNGWTFRGTEVLRLSRPELPSVYEGFTIANHSLNHPHLDRLPIIEAREEITEGRNRLQDWFGQPVSGFAYPFGSYNQAVMDIIRETGHVYARTVGMSDRPFPPADPMALHPNCHFLDPSFKKRFERARAGGVFYFWGHSYEMIDDTMWSAFEVTITWINDDPETIWGDIARSIITGL